MPLPAARSMLPSPLKSAAAMAMESRAGSPIAELTGGLNWTGGPAQTQSQARAVVKDAMSARRRRALANMGHFPSISFVPGAKSSFRQSRSKSSIPAGYWIAEMFDHRFGQRT